MARKRIIEARVRQKTDTLEVWMNNSLPLLDGEQAFIRSDVDGEVIGFKLASEGKTFSELPYPDFTARGKVSPMSSWDGRQSGLYIPTLNGTYNGIPVNLTDGYQVLYWDGLTVEKVVYPNNYSNPIFGGVIDDTKDLSTPPDDPTWYIASPGSYNTVPTVNLTENSILTWNGIEWSHIPFELEVRGEFLVADNIQEVRNITTDVAQLLVSGTYKAIQVLGYYSPDDTPAPINYYISDTTNPDDGGSVLEAGGVKLEHVFKDKVHVSYFGVNPNQSDNTANFDNLADYISDGQTIEFDNDTYVGNFVVTGKSINVNLNNSTITPEITGIGGLVIKGSLGSVHIVNTSISYPKFNDISLELDNVDGLSKGDILQLEDEAKRTSDNAGYQNLEVVKIKSILGNVVSITGTLRGTFNTGVVTATKLNTISNIKITGAKFIDNPINLQPLLWIRYAENVIVDNILVENFYGNAVRFDSIYSGQVTNLYLNNPRSTGSGEGYGLAINESKHLFLNNIHGDGTRHLVDFKSSYDCVLDTYFEPDGVEAVIMVCHNGFGGFITVRNGFSEGQSYAVATHNQGFISQPNEDIQVHRGYVIEQIKHVWKGKTTDQSITGASVLGDYSDITIKDVSCTYDGSVPPTTLTLSASVVQIIGNKKGVITVENIKTDVIGCIVRDNVRTNTTSVRLYPSYYNNLYAERCLNPVWISGNGNIFIDGMFVNTLDDALFRLTKNTALYPNYINVTDKGLYWTLRSANSLVIGATSTMDDQMIKGSFPLLTAGSGSGLVLVDNGFIPRNRLFNSGKYINLIPPINTNIILSSSTPIELGLWEGQEINLAFRAVGVTTETGTITIPSDSLTVENSSPIIMQSGYIYKFIFYANKWRLDTH